MNPCIDCKNRFPGCHAACGDGIAFENSVKAAKEKIKSEKSIDDMMRIYNASRLQKRVAK